MLQVLFEIPGTGIRIHGFGLMLFLAFLSAMNLAAWLARRSRLNPNDVFDLAIWLIIGGLVGARGFYVLQHRETIESFLDIFKVWEGGIVLYGSGLGASAAFALFWRSRRFPFRPMLDVSAPAIALGVAIGRIGCFLNGCCYGEACDLPWAVSFPSGTLPWIDQVRSGELPAAAAQSLPVHPTQLYSTLDGLLLCLLLLAYFPLRRRDGEVMALLLVTYPITRFLIEQLRDDEGVFFAGMTVSQNGSLLVMLAGLAFWGYLSRLPKGRYADQAPVEAPPPPGRQRARPGFRLLSDRAIERPAGTGRRGGLPRRESSGTGGPLGSSPPPLETSPGPGSAIRSEAGRPRLSGPSGLPFRAPGYDRGCARARRRARAPRRRPRS